MRLKHIIILQNKVDLIKDGAADEQFQQIQAFVKGAHAAFIPALMLHLA